MDAAGGMSKKLGPLKVWQWGVLGGGVLLAYYLYEKKKGTTATTEEAEPLLQSQSVPNEGNAGTGTGSGSGEGSGTSTAPTLSSEVPTPGPPPAEAAPKAEAAPAALTPAAEGANTSPVKQSKPATASPHGVLKGTKHTVNAQGEHFTVNSYANGFRAVFQTSAEKAADAGERARAALGKKKTTTHAAQGKHVTKDSNSKSKARAAHPVVKKAAKKTPKKPAAKHASAHKTRAR